MARTKTNPAAGDGGAGSILRTSSRPASGTKSSPGQIIQRHPLTDRGDDLYETPACAVEVLLRAEPDDFDTFEAACADAKRAAIPDDPGLARLRRLMNESVSIERAYAELNCREGAAASTVEALVYGLREGIAAQRTRPDRLRRLSELSEGQLRVVCERLVNFKPHIASAWTEEAVQALVKIWSGGHAK
jgi:hypothetical protein